MTSANVELVRRVFDCWNRRDPDAALELLSPDAELDASDRILNPDIYSGADGLMRFSREVAEPWERFQLDIEEAFESDDQVVVFVRSIGIGRGSGVEVDVRSAWVVTVSDERITSLRLYRERNAALQAVGLA
jgi:ketosteroid isomerase-like protein